MKTGRFLVVSVVVALAGVVVPAVAQTVETGLEHFQGRWTWNGSYKAKMDAGNVSRIQFADGDKVSYCYNTKCWAAKVTFGTGGSYAFSTGGGNRFEFSPLDETRTVARFWVKFTPDSQLPDASAIFTLKSGH